MTYNELDEYGVRRKETGEKIEALKLPAGALFSDYPEELRKEMRNNALFVVQQSADALVSDVFHQG